MKNFLQGVLARFFVRKCGGGGEVGSNAFGLMINLVANLIPAKLAFGYLHFCPVYTANGHFQEGHVGLDTEKVVASCIWMLRLAKKKWPGAKG